MAESLDTPRSSLTGRSTPTAEMPKPGAVSYGTRPISGRHATDHKASVAATLAELGVRPGERVLIMLPDGPGFIDVFVGVIQRGAVPLPVNPLLEARDLTVVAAEAGARLVVATRERIHALTDLEAGPLTLVDGPQGYWTAWLRPS